MFQRCNLKIILMCRYTYLKVTKYAYFTNRLHYETKFPTNEANFFTKGSKPKCAPECSCF